MKKGIFALTAVVALMAGLGWWLRPGGRAAPAALPVPEAASASAELGVARPGPAAPPLRAAAAGPQEPRGDSPPGNILARLLKQEEPPVPSLAQVAGYLRAKHRDAESLLGAFHATREPSLLREAKEAFPGDPRVQFVGATQSETSEERRQWIDALKQSEPANALANYLSAAEYFNCGESALALGEVEAGAGKPLQDFQLEFLQTDEEAYRGAGYSEADARSLAAINQLLPDLGAYKNVGYTLVELANAYREANDMASAQGALGLALQLARRINVPDSLTLAQTVTSLAIEQKALGAMDPAAGIGEGDRTAREELEAVTQQREAVKALNQQWATVAPGMSDQDLAAFFQRKSSFGELAGEQWAVQRFAPPLSISRP